MTPTPNPRRVCRCGRELPATVSGDEKLRRLRAWAVENTQKDSWNVDVQYGVVAEIDRLLAEPAAPPPDPVAGDARISGVDGDELLRDWLRTGHNPLGSEQEAVVAELARRALADRGGEHDS